jgi:hypothetical protein
MWTLYSGVVITLYFTICDLSKLFTKAVYMSVYIGTPEDDRK